MRVHAGLAVASTLSFLLGAAGLASAAEGPTTSTGAAALRYQETRSLPTSIETGFMGPKDIAQIKVGIAIDPVKAGGPLYSVDMPRGALIEANWGTDRRILLKTQTGLTNDGMVTVHHTLTPTVTLIIPPLGLDFTYGGSALLNKLPGAQWDYDARGSQTFAPWGFVPVDMTLSTAAANSATRKVFELDAGKIVELFDNEISGKVGVKANANPTFSYKTRKVTLGGIGDAITNESGEVSVPAVDGDFMEVTASVEGEMTVRGSIGVEPYFELDGIPGFGTASLGLTVYRADFETPTTAVPFQGAIVHIPLPNVHPAKKAVDLGFVGSGDRTSKTVVIENSGEKDAVMTFKSGDDRFDVPGQTITVPAKSSYDLEITFSSSDPQPASTEIKILSNDADSPEQIIRVGANGADVGDEDGTSGPKGDDGCGCKAAGASGVPSWAGFGLLGLLSAVTMKRRRR